MSLRTHLAKTADPIVLHEVSPADEKLERGFCKPAGFWYEVDGDWRRWCEDEHFGLDGPHHLHEVDLGSSHVLKIRTAKELDTFHHRFGIQQFRDVPKLHHAKQPDWSAVGEEYDGIEIAPYQWSRRLEFGFTWYYSWDCASGVIWRPRDAVVSYVGPIELQARRYEDAEA